MVKHHCSHVVKDECECLGQKLMLVIVTASIQEHVVSPVREQVGLVHTDPRCFSTEGAALF